MPKQTFALLHRKNLARKQKFAQIITESVYFSAVTTLFRAHFEKRNAFEYHRSFMIAATGMTIIFFCHCICIQCD